MSSQLDQNTAQDSPIVQRNQRESGATELWASIRNIIELQNQAPKLEPFSRGRAAPMSFNQERLWLLDQLRPKSSVYNIPFAFRIIGDLDISILDRSLLVCLNRHEVLRTVLLRDESDTAIQYVHTVPHRALTYQTLELASEAEPSLAISRFLQKEARSPFDLAQGPLLRASLLEISHQDYVFILNVHHAIFDGWSEGILLGEISTAYSIFSSGEALSLEPLPIQYADFSIWQRQWLKGNFRQALLDYWQRTLDGLVDELVLPADHSRPTQELRLSDQEKFYIDQEMTSALKKLARQTKATLFPTLLAAFNVLLYHYTNQVDIAVCTPTASRNRRELKGLIGYFVNLLVIRADLSGAPSFQQLVARVKQAASGASAHQDLPAQDLASCLTGNQSVLSQILFAWQNTPQKPFSLSGLEVQRLNVDNSTADFDLFLSLTEEAGTIRGDLKYNTDLFEAASVVQLLKHYKQILAKAIANPEASVDRLLELSDTERQMLADKRHRGAPPISVQTQESASFVAPRNDIEQTLVKIWQAVLKVDPIGIRDDFFALGGKSLAAVELFGQIEKAFGKKLPFSQIFQAPTIEALAVLLAQESTINQWKSLVPIQPEGSKPPIYCIHSVEPSVLHYRNISTYLDADQPFYCLQPPALIGSEDLIFSNVESMAAYYIYEIQQLQPQPPYFLMGHSMGGLIAYEMACQLQLQGQEVAFLGLLDTFAPGYQPRPRYYMPPLFYQLYIHCRNFIKVPPQRKLGYVLQRLKKVVPKRIWNQLDTSKLLVDELLHKELPDIYKSLPIYRTIKVANYKAYNTYSPTYQYRGNITLYRALERPVTTQYYPDLGWGKLLPQKIEIQEVPGHHNAMVHEPYVQVLVQKIRQSIDQRLHLLKH